MAADPIVTVGDDISLTRGMYEGGVLTNLSGATIVAAIQDGDGNILVGPVTQSSSATGASWTGGIVVCEFPAALTTGLPIGFVSLEIEVTRAGKKNTWPLIDLQVQPASIR